MKLYVIRHGESYINLGNWDTLEDLDTGLTPLGIRQAEALRDWFKENDVKADVLYASTMKRTQETAQYVSDGLGLDVKLDDRLREIGNNYNDGSIVKSQDLPRDWLDLPGYSAPFNSRSISVTNLESWMHFRIRVGQFVGEMISNHQDQDVYVVAHGGVVDVLMEHVFNTGPYRNYGIHTYNTGWSCVHYDIKRGVGHWTLLHHNRIDHLVGIDY